MPVVNEEPTESFCEMKIVDMNRVRNGSTYFCSYCRFVDVHLNVSLKNISTYNGVVISYCVSVFYAHDRSKNEILHVSSVRRRQWLCLWARPSDKCTVQYCVWSQNTVFCLLQRKLHHRKVFFCIKLVEHVLFVQAILACFSYFVRDLMKFVWYNHLNWI